MESNEKDDTNGELDHIEELQIDPEQVKGDAIGDTVYSERFVIRLLMKLMQYDDNQWTEEMEADLCILWDMTATNAVVDFLMQHNCLELFTSLTQSTTNPRFIEILIGMIGNMCCNKNVRLALCSQEDTQESLLSLLSNPDPQSLVQLMRLLECIAWDLLKPEATELLTPDKHWFEKHLESEQFAIHVAFILSSSTCDELLNGVLVLLNTICSLNINDKDFSLYFATPELVAAMLECWSQLFSSCQNKGDFEFPNKQLEKSACNWVSVILSFAGHEKGRFCLGKFAEQINDILELWIQVPKDGSEVLLNSVIWLLEGIVGYKFSSTIFIKLLKVIHRTISNKDDTTPTEADFEDDTTDLDKLSLKEGFKSYCIAVRKHVAKEVLVDALSLCRSKHVALFWSMLEEQDSPPSA